MGIHGPEPLIPGSMFLQSEVTNAEMLQWPVVETYAMWPPEPAEETCWSALVLIRLIVVNQIHFGCGNFHHLPTFQHSLKISTGRRRDTSLRSAHPARKGDVLH